MGPRLGQTRTHLEGDDQVHLVAHDPDEFGSQLARQADLWGLWASDAGGTARGEKGWSFSMCIIMRVCVSEI